MHSLPSLLAYSSLEAMIYLTGLPLGGLFCQMVLLPTNSIGNSSAPGRRGERIIPDGRKALEQVAQVHHMERKRQAVLERLSPVQETPVRPHWGSFSPAFDPHRLAGAGVQKKQRQDDRHKERTQKSNAIRKEKEHCQVPASFLMWDNEAEARVFRMSSRRVWRSHS